MAAKTRKRDVFFGILEGVGEALAQQAEEDRKNRALARAIVDEQQRRCARPVMVVTPQVRPMIAGLSGSGRYRDYKNGVYIDWDED